MERVVERKGSRRWRRGTGYVRDVEEMYRMYWEGVSRQGEGTEMQSGSTRRDIRKWDWHRVFKVSRGLQVHRPHQTETDPLTSQIVALFTTLRPPPNYHLSPINRS